MKGSSDELIMNRVKNGDLAGMSVLFERYHVKLYNFMLKLTFNRTLSQDLTQNLFYRVIKYRQTYNPNYSFKSWIYQLARNVHIDYCKQQFKESGRMDQVENYDPNIKESNNFFDEDDYQKLDEALAKLNPEQKEIIVLSRFQRLNYEEISTIQNSTVAAVKVRMHRAIKQLRHIYFNQIS